MKSYFALGLMSGTSLDGIDVALIETDGQTFSKSLGATYYPYNDDFRHRLQSFLGTKAYTPALRGMEKELTLLHVEAVAAFFNAYPAYKEKVDIIGFHGQTVFHKPRHFEEGFFKEAQSLQIGDGALLSKKTGIPVVYNMRQNDIKHGGEGAPFVPVYHQVLTHDLPKPVAILNIGGVSNITWIGEGSLRAYDMGPGNALLNDWVLRTTGKHYDEGGALAKHGTVIPSYVRHFLEHPFFEKKPPKSLDRQTFSIPFEIDDVSKEDGAATLTEMTIMAIKRGMDFFPEPVQHIYIAGGGVHNTYLMRRLQEALFPLSVHSISDLGHVSDFLEAEAWGFLAVRRKEGLPLTFPGTTGVELPVTGGMIVYP